MFVKTDHAVDPRAQAVLFYIYAPELPALREQLLACGVQAPAIQYPGYMPSGELRLDDRDGYVVLIGHWGEAAHVAWEKRIGRKAYATRRSALKHRIPLEAGVFRD